MNIKLSVYICLLLLFQQCTLTFQSEVDEDGLYMEESDYYDEKDLEAIEKELFERLRATSVGDGTTVGDERTDDGQVNRDNEGRVDIEVASTTETDQGTGDDSTTDIQITDQETERDGSTSDIQLTDQETERNGSTADIPMTDLEANNDETIDDIDETNAVDPADSGSTDQFIHDIQTTNTIMGESAAEIEPSEADEGEIEIRVKETEVNQPDVVVHELHPKEDVDLVQLVKGSTDLVDVTSDGKIKTTATWDYESLPSEKMISIQVAYYNASGYEISAENISIYIEDANDEPPEITNQPRPLQVVMPITTPPRTSIYTFLASDPDTTSEIRFKITRQQPEGMFDLDDVDGTLYSRINPPYPNGVEYVVCVVAEDKNGVTPQQSQEVQLSVIAGRKPPEFLQPSYIATIPENLTVGHIILTFEARSFSDKPLQYLLSDDQDPSLPFSIETEDNRGILRLSRELDIDEETQQDSYRFMVEVTEEASQMQLNLIGEYEDINQNGAASVQVHIQDSNDNAPVLKEEYTVTVMENQPPQEILEVEATDKDKQGGGNGAPFSFALDTSATDDIKRSFAVRQSVDEGSGDGSAVIISARSFDREERASYEIPIIIQDSGEPRLSSTGTVTVKIGNEQDTPMKPFNKPILVYKYKDFIPKTVIGSVYAVDMDGWNTINKTFHWKHEPQQQFFNLSEETGELTIMEETPVGQYELYFTIKEKLTEESVDANVSVTVKNLPSLENTIVPLKLSGISANEFLKDLTEKGEHVESRYRHFVRKIKKNLPVRKRELRVVDIVSVMETIPQLLQIIVSARRLGKKPRYFKNSKIRRLIRGRIRQIKAEVGVSVIEVGLDPCKTVETCYTCEALPPVVNPQPHVIDTGGTSFVGVSIDYIGDCSREQPVLHLKLSNHLQNIALEHINQQARSPYSSAMVTHFYALATEYIYRISIELEQVEPDRSIRSCSMMIHQITKTASDLNCQCVDGWEEAACQCRVPKIGCSEPDSDTFCSGRGTCDCGECNCSNTTDGPYRGQLCELEPLNEALCMLDESSSLCSGHGDCVPRGRCVCHQPYEGQYCECNNYECPLHDGQLCGGMGRGECECGECKCNISWTGEACECLTPEAGCTAPGTNTVCSDQGQCECGTCVCHEAEYGLYFGNFCENVPPPPRSVYIEFCKATPSADFCSGVGECHSPGVCECQDTFSGTYCECDDFSCGSFKGEMCGGEDHGHCQCGSCVCKEGWIGEMCECRTVEVGCMRDLEGTVCSNRGDCICGQCQCQETEEMLYEGQFCETSRIRPYIISERCTWNNSVCSDRGECSLEGCVCDKQEQQDHYVYGRFCECDNFTCASYDGRICSGVEHGVCDCGECKCDDNYEGASCHISLYDESCMLSNDTAMCSGLGDCIFGECFCDKTIGGNYQGQFCEEKPSHEDICHELSSCVKCHIFDLDTCNVECPIMNVTYVPINDTDSEEMIATKLPCESMEINECTYVLLYQADSPDNLLLTTSVECFPEPQPQYMTDAELCIHVHPCLECVMYKIYKYDREECDKRCSNVFIDEIHETTYEEEKEFIEQDYHTCPLVKDNRNCDVQPLVTVTNTSAASVLFVRPRCGLKWDSFSKNGCDLLWPCVQCMIFKTTQTPSQECLEKCFDLDIYLPRSLIERRERRKGRKFCKVVDDTDNCEVYFSFNVKDLPILYVQRKKRCRNS